MFNLRFLNEFYFTVLLMIFFIGAYSDLTTHKANLITMIFMAGIIGVRYYGGFIRKWRDIVLLFLFYSAIVLFWFFKYGLFKPGKTAIGFFILLIVYFAGYFIGKLVNRKHGLLEKFEYGIAVLASLLLILTIMRDYPLVMSIWLMVCTVFIIHLIQRGYSLLSISLILSPFYFISILMDIFGNSMFSDIIWVSFAVQVIILLIAYKRKFSFQSRIAYVFIAVVSIIALLVVLPLNNNILNQKRLSTFIPPDEIFMHPVVYMDDTISLSEFKGKVLVLDFWNSACGVCFSQFPEFEKLANRYKDNENVLVFAVNALLRNEDPNKPKEIMERLNYSFENLYLPNDSTAKALNVYYYPNLIYIDADQEQAIKGSLNTNRLVINNSISIIDKLIKKQKN